MHCSSRVLLFSVENVKMIIIPASLLLLIFQGLALILDLVNKLKQKLMPPVPSGLCAVGRRCKVNTELCLCLKPGNAVNISAWKCVKAQFWGEAGAGAVMRVCIVCVYSTRWWKQWSMDEGFLCNAPLMWLLFPRTWNMILFSSTKTRLWIGLSFNECVCVFKGCECSLTYIITRVKEGNISLTVVLWCHFVCMV